MDSIEQFFVRVKREQKLEVLTRFLEVEQVDGVIIFSRTKNSSNELAEKLQARGYAAASLNGDMKQSAREKVIDRLKASKLDIVVATDIAARGIDVDRITHVINFDIPYDTESYIHRIGRTGRAGRKGKAILFVTPRERNMLRDIEHAIQRPIDEAAAPTVEEMMTLRHQQLGETLAGIINKSKKVGAYYDVVDTVTEQAQCTHRDVAAAIAYLMYQASPLPDEDLSPAISDKKKKRRKPQSSGPKKKYGAKSKKKNRSPR